MRRIIQPNLGTRDEALTKKRCYVNCLLHSILGYMHAIELVKTLLHNALIVLGPPTYPDVPVYALSCLPQLFSIKTKMFPLSSVCWSGSLLTRLLSPV